MKLVSLISSGIDSPVATYLMSKKAEKIILLHGDIKPFTDENTLNNFLKLAKHLKNISKSEISVFVLSHGKSLEKYKLNCEEKFTCIFCKRMLLRYAEAVCKKYSFDAVVMGDSLGQVASQTLQNINTIESAIKTPVLRPLIGYDKQEIIKIAKEIGTYELSILPSIGCTAVPNKPATEAKLEKIINEEEKLDIENLINQIIDNLLVVKI